MEFKFNLLTFLSTLWITFVHSQLAGMPQNNIMFPPPHIMRHLQQRRSQQQNPFMRGRMSYPQQRPFYPARSRLRQGPPFYPRPMGMNYPQQRTGPLPMPGGRPLPNMMRRISQMPRYSARSQPSVLNARSSFAPTNMTFGQPNFSSKFPSPAKSPSAPKTPPFRNMASMMGGMMPMPKMPGAGVPPMSKMGDMGANAGMMGFASPSQPKIEMPPQHVLNFLRSRKNMGFPTPYTPNRLNGNFNAPQYRSQPFGIPSPPPFKNLQMPKFNMPAFRPPAMPNFSRGPGAPGSGMPDMKDLKKEMAFPEESFFPKKDNKDNLRK